MSAPDIDVDWIANARCSVCADWGKVTANAAGDGLVCQDCGTTWTLVGEQGERDA